MGLSCSHGAWHGGYSSFMNWRCKLAEVAGLPPLELMEGFYSPFNQKPIGLPTLYYGMETSNGEYLREIDSQLPIKWKSLRPDPLFHLLTHSDCDGHIPPKRCKKIAERLEQLLPHLPDEDGGGHIWNWKEVTQQFIDGLRSAYENNESLMFR